MPQPTVMVRKQVYDLRARSRAAAHDLHRRLERAHRERVVAVLAEVMEELAAGDDLLLIDRLELDLGTLHAENVEAQLAERIEECLRERLAGDIAEVLQRLAGGGAARRLTGARARLELLNTFLVTGMLPWWAPPDAVPLTRSLDEALLRSPLELAAMLRRADAARVAARLARQFPAEQVERVAALLGGTRGGEMVALLRDAASCCAAVRHGGGEPLPADASMRIGAAVVGALCRGATAVDEVATQVVRQLAPAGEEDLAGALLAAARRVLPAGSAVRRALQPAPAPHTEAPAAPRSGADRRTAAGPAPPPAIAAPPPAAVQPPSPAAPPAGPATAPGVVGPGPPATGRQPAADAGAPGGPAARARRDPRPAEGGDTAFPGGAGAAALHVVAPPRSAPGAGGAAVIDEHVGTLVDNAGLVLVWPFLTRFFGELGLVEKGSFRGPGERERAVQLLHRVVTGDDHTPEHRLVLNKLLCGFPLDEPVAGRLEVTDAENREIGELYDSVLHNWVAVGNTSAEGLRASFLQREGALSHRDLGWNLAVARVAYDVLLDRLPWGIGLVMLPWMEQPLAVEW